MMINTYGTVGGKEMIRETNYLEKTKPTATLSTTYPTSNLAGGKPVIDSLSYEMDHRGILHLNTSHVS
jgi:hypothetical protein